jgi:hypothetical protein
MTPAKPKKSSYQLDSEIAEALAEAKLRPASAANKVDVLRVRLSRGLGSVIARTQHALFVATKSTPTGYIFESSDGGTIRALWHKLSNLYWRPPGGAGGQAIGQAAGKKLAELRPIIAASWPEALAE